jgi:hypothetical protein
MCYGRQLTQFELQESKFCCFLAMIADNTPFITEKILTLLVAINAMR